MMPALLIAALATLADRPDIVAADFEGADYAGWTATGSAFGTRPARGALPGQMEVSGFLGKGLVNSFEGGDGSTGTLTSPPLTIERPYLNFLIGGGKHPGSTCVNLLVDGKVVRTATGPNDRPGGSERLDWASWDVRDLIGRKAVVQVVDTRTGGWGHVNLDHLTQSDRKRANEPAARTIVVERRYLHLPVKRSAAVRRVKVAADDRTLRDFDIRLPLDGEAADFQVFIDLERQRGQTIRVETLLPGGSHALDAISQADTVPSPETLYREKDRPQFHFTARRGWLNDPNGLVWQDGQYHLFFQQDPYAWAGEDKHWGHAVSPDLLRWTELGVAIAPREYDDWVYSGSAVVDLANTSGWGKPGRPAMVAAFTSTGRGECVVHSLDGGRTWTEFEGNPVVKHQGRDPRLLWHEPTRRWVMAVYDEAEGKRWIAFHTSPDLKTWTAADRIEGFYECPDLFELPVRGKPGRSRWVIHAADGQYLLGDFDGRRFRPDEPEKKRVWYGNFYAAQTFSNAPGGRRVQIGWGQGISFPRMPFNQQMTAPVELTLRETPDGLRMFAEPVVELASLRASRLVTGPLTISPGRGMRRESAPDLLEFGLEGRVDSTSALTLTVRGVPIVVDGRKQRLSCGDVDAPLAMGDRPTRLVVLLDRGSLEVFADGGQVAISKGAAFPDGDRGFALSAAGGDVRLDRFDVHELRSTWTAR